MSWPGRSRTGLPPSENLLLVGPPQQWKLSGTTVAHPERSAGRGGEAEVNRDPLEDAVPGRPVHAFAPNARSPPPARTRSESTCWPRANCRSQTYPPDPQRCGRARSGRFGGPVWAAGKSAFRLAPGSRCGRRRCAIRSQPWRRARPP
jgi:hypothetical protein